MKKPRASMAGGGVGSLVFLLSAYLVFSIAYATAVPSFEKPDEPGHLGMARFLLAERRLPRPLASPPYHEVHWGGQQPPLYYALSAVLLGLAGSHSLDGLGISELDHAMIVDRKVAERILASGVVPRPNPSSPAFGGRDPRHFQADPRDSFPYRRPFLAVRLLRLSGLPWGLVTVLLTWIVSCRLLGTRGPWAAVATGIVALNPQFLFLCGSLSNDSMAFAFAAALTAGAIAVLDTAPQGASVGQAAGMGVLAGAGLLVKLSVVPAVGAALLALVAAGGRRLAGAIRGAALYILPAAAVGGWWFAWNMVHSGDALNFGSLVRSQPAYLAHHPLLSRYFLSLEPGALPVRVFKSFWAHFGWQTVAAPSAVYWVLLVLTVAGFTGFVAAGPDRRAPRFLRSFLLIHTAFSVALLVRQNLDLNAAQGRYLFASLPPIALMLAFGLRHWAGRIGIRDRVAAGGVAAVMLAANVACLRVILTVYGAP